MPAPPSVIVVDVNETPSDMSSIAQRFSMGASEHLAKLWFATLLRDGFVLTTAGAQPPFTQLGVDALHTVLAGVDLDPDMDAAVDHVMAGFSQLDSSPTSARASGCCAGRDVDWGPSQRLRPALGALVIRHRHSRPVRDAAVGERRRDVESAHAGISTVDQPDRQPVPGLLHRTGTRSDGPHRRRHAADVTGPVVHGVVGRRTHHRGWLVPT